jgi:hypothetical protein
MPTFSPFATTILLVLAMLAPATLPAATCEQLGAELPRVRPLQPRIESTLRKAYDASPTLRELVEGIERSDVIVYLEHRVSLTRRDGSLRFAAMAGGQRYLRITLRPVLSSRSLVAMLAHELQHAAEVAHACDVIDAAGMRALYRRIGVAQGSSRYYETEAARDTAEQVLREWDAAQTGPTAQ